jgi:hypothetical protein
VAGLGLVLWSVLPAPGGARAAWGALVLALLHPGVVRALEYGHPEEVVGAGAVRGGGGAGPRGPPVPAGLVLGLAGANKPWAVVAAAAGPPRPPRAARALRARRRGGLRARSSRRSSWRARPPWPARRAVATRAPDDLQADAAVWFLGDPAARGRARDPSGAPMGSAGSRIPPSSSAASTAAAWLPRRRAGTHPAGDALLLLALVLLTRCLLDVWTMTYYFAPFALALLAWEAGVRGRAPSPRPRPPRRSSSPTCCPCPTPRPPSRSRGRCPRGA